MSARDSPISDARRAVSTTLPTLGAIVITATQPSLSNNGSATLPLDLTASV